MKNCDTNKVGLVFGAMAGGAHLLWSVLIFLNLAQPLADFVFNVHSVNPVYIIMPFDLTRSLELIILTSVVGYVVGFVVATVWNTVHR